MKGALDSIFKAKSVAVVGASTNPGKLGYQILENMINAGFKGDIFPVNPKAKEILGLTCINDAMDLPEGIDLAVMIIPAKIVSSTLDGLGQKGLKSSVVITGGFAEAGEEGEALQKDLTEVGLRRGVRIIGPNCQGVNYPFSNLCASWPLITLRGGMAIISQSGTVGAAMIDWASEENLGFSAFVSMGNRADVDESELIDYFSVDPNTRVITLYIEGVKDPARFEKALKSCKKPVVIFKAGRTERGKVAAESHTKSLAGSDEVFNAIFRKYGVVRANSLEELYDYSKALAYFPRPAGNRVLIVTSSGGAAIIAIDMAEELGFSVEPLSEAKKKEISEILPSHFIVGNPIDLTGDGDAAMFGKVMEMAEDEYDIIMPIFGDPIPGAWEIVSPDKPHLVTYVGGADVEREERVRMGGKKVAVFPTPERAIVAASAYLGETAGAEVTSGIDKAEEEGTLLTPVDSFALLERYDIDVPPYFKVSGEKDAATYSGSIGFPVVMKVNSSHVVHKSDEGGVILNISSQEEASEKFTGIANAFKERGVTIDGALVCKQMPPGVEVIMGVIRDAQFGHVMALGLGGVFVEVMKDVSFRMMPVTQEDVRNMIDELRGGKLLKGVRGMAPSDMDALSGLALKVSELIEENPQIVEMDLNPVMVYEKGISVLDARVIVGA